MFKEFKLLRVEAAISVNNKTYMGLSAKLFRKNTKSQIKI